MGYLREEATDLLKYAQNYNRHFISRKCQDVIVEARRLMTSEIHDTVKVRRRQLVCLFVCLCVPSVCVSLKIFSQVIEMSPCLPTLFVANCRSPQTTRCLSRRCPGLQGTRRSGAARRPSPLRWPWSSLGVSSSNSSSWRRAPWPCQPAASAAPPSRSWSWPSPRWLRLQTGPTQGRPTGCLYRCVSVFVFVCPCVWDREKGGKPWCDGVLNTAWASNKYWSCLSVCFLVSVSLKCTAAWLQQDCGVMCWWIYGIALVRLALCLCWMMPECNFIFI